MEYHSGELEIQSRLGVQQQAQQLAQGIGTIIKPAAREFLHQQRLAIASTADSKGKVWASLLTGEPRFMQALTEQSVQINANLIPGDPLNENLLSSADLGLLVIDLATRRRLRLNGKAQIRSDGTYLHTQQVYFNCPKYIQVRYLETQTTEQRSVSKVTRTETLTPTQLRGITQADTFFIASFHPESGADASHRGGYPGFVRSLNANQLLFPDYSGNNMFNTLGNIAVNPQVGLLFINFEQGSTLQLTGKAEIIWNREQVAFAAAERLVQFTAEQVLEITNASSLSWEFVEYSPYNPKVDTKHISSP